ncbi:UDP-N-acetylmuramoyl-L-alanine--D-glutamate ligase [Blastomonas marina]|uniref:UDP-N-acetylmuramoyl-L-alanine--D-glutamate ligase n=1 Tax=Blastomonas marina TaxID=1867408 RepID=UPI002AC94E0E|nr:UDP-N-acetylmuramoyl-L-alanine--D-glutamate ligase [Blastomonas marina]WPZ02785.1 UDP-N-acetylmuramoyl-L-alanine--D-glutamate ligase [Blastomonas marina]
MKADRAFAGKRYAVLGLARSGRATVQMLVDSGAEVTAWDSREEPRQQVPDGVTLADPLMIDLKGFDGVVVSPGVPLNRHPIVAAAQRANVPLIGDIELFAQMRDELPPHRVVGITGTNGKSTTTALVHHLFEQAGVPSLMGGNIGKPILGEDALPAHGVYVLELSSYQIDITQTLSCDVAALLNITPDHLDRYADFADYAGAKARLFAMQDADRHAVFGMGDAQTCAVALRERARRGEALVHEVEGAGLAHLQHDWPSLQGPHNLQNVAVAVAICEIVGLTPEQWLPALKTFPGLPHRMERVAEHRGVTFVNDSKATNPASAAPALAAFPPDPGPRIHWICGGLPKGDRLDECEQYFGYVKAAYTIGDAGPRFAELLASHTEVTRSEMLGDAVRAAMAAADEGDVVLLAPACASFDQFRDYEARGDAFRQIVTALIEDHSEAAL